MTTPHGMFPLTEDKVVAAIEHNGGVARLLGGRAVMRLCGGMVPEVFLRNSEDIDIVIRNSDRQALKRAMKDLGCTPDHEFNILNGKERLIFYHGDMKLDVFVNIFRMCHTLYLGDRLRSHPLTLSPADLLLTKLQVVQAEPKDLSDTAALLLSAYSDTAGQTALTIDHEYIGGVLGRDWGLWRTATGTLHKINAQAEVLCKDPLIACRLRSAVAAFLEAIGRAPRSMGWRIRAIIGDRRIWYELPEEPTT